MDEKEFRRLLKEQEDMREKVQIESKGNTVQIKINMDEIVKQVEQMMNENNFDESEFYFQKPKKTKKRFWKKDVE
jgi:hypothetical protein